MYSTQIKHRQPKNMYICNSIVSNNMLQTSQNLVQDFKFDSLASRIIKTIDCLYTEYEHRGEVEDDEEYEHSDHTH